MKKVRYAVASSLDGFIAGPNGEIDWIIMDPEIDFAALYAKFDTFLMGRSTYEWMLKHGEEWMPKAETIVFSSKMRQEDYPKVKVSADPIGVATELRKKEGKDIWLFGGGVLFRTLLEVNLVDAVEVAVMPVVLGDGIPLLPPPFRQSKLRLETHRIYASGIASLEYSVV